MMKLELVSAALADLRRAEDLIVTEMATNGIPDPACIIHRPRNPGELPRVTLYSSAEIFACGIRRLRRRRNVDCTYGEQVITAIAAAERFQRGRNN